MLRSKDEVQNWADANGGDECVRIAVTQKRFGMAAEAYGHINEWLRDQDEKKSAAAADADRQFREREVVAAERSAVAAENSARFAKWAAVCAGIAAIIAVISLVVQLVGA
ncbi:hypothetical protein [Herbaspirillum sp. NPDC101397]|uniref:hypothetical protein n=1 Tax=Herbaspirillum sp. NPDC101397 TaxID=3364006 RepID=UPI00383AF1F5